MQNVQRSSVEFDMCPQCRGVWLDRGELEKILTEARHTITDGRLDSPRRPPETRVATPQRRDWDDDDDYRYGHKPGSHGDRKRTRFNIFDVFD